MMNSTTSLAEAAYIYAQRAMAVFPLRPKSKAPYGHTQGVHDATFSSAATYDSWFARPNSNIGYAISSKVIVVDVDPRNGGQESEDALFEAGKAFWPTLMSHSGRGDGGHHYFLSAPESEHGLRGQIPGYPGIDIKKEGGYVLLPPSIHPDSHKPYRWHNEHEPIQKCPEWLAELIRLPKPEAVINVAQLPLMEQLEHNTGGWTAEGLVTTMSIASPGERNNVLNWALWQLRTDRTANKCTRAQFTQALLDIQRAALDAGLPEREVDRTIGSAFRGDKK